MVLRECLKEDDDAVLKQYSVRELSFSFLSEEAPQDDNLPESIHKCMSEAK